MSDIDETSKDLDDLHAKSLKNSKKYDDAAHKTKKWFADVLRDYINNPDAIMKATLEFKDYIDEALALGSFSEMIQTIQKDMAGLADNTFEKEFTGSVLPTMLFAKFLQEIDKIRMEKYE